jgi:hypothetical protein
VIQIFPFALWLAIVSSTVLLIALWASGDVRRVHGAVLTGWLLLAGYLQFFGRSAALSVTGLVLQTVLAIYLALRAKLTL